MKNLSLILLALLCLQCTAQEPLIIRQEKIEDISDTPIYPQMTEEKDGQTTWKPEYAYMDDIELYKITYRSDGLKISGLMVKPKKEGKYPAVIYNRGGNRDFGALKIFHAAIWMGQLAKEGYVTIASNYRGSPGSEGQEEFGGKDVNDVLILTEVLKEVEAADTDKIGMYGWSRGGMMTYLALTKTDQIKAAVTGGAPADKTVIDRPAMETNVYAELIPNYWENKTAELKKRSAVFFADQFPKDVPLLILHGTSDWRVKPIHSLKLAMELDKHRVPYRLIMFEGGDHGIREHKTEVNQQVLAWFDRYLKNNEPLPNMEFHGK